MYDILSELSRFFLVAAKGDIVAVCDHKKAQLFTAVLYIENVTKRKLYLEIVSGNCFAVSFFYQQLLGIGHGFCFGLNDGFRFN